MVRIKGRRGLCRRTENAAGVYRPSGVFKCCSERIGNVVSGGVGEDQGYRKGTGHKIIGGCYWRKGWGRGNPDTGCKGIDLEIRSEERRVGKEGRSRWP